MNQQSNFVWVFRHISENVTIILSSIEVSETSCRNTVFELIQNYWQVAQYLQAEGYLQKVQQHALLNLGLLFDKVAFPKYLTIPGAFGGVLRGMVVTG